MINDKDRWTPVKKTPDKIKITGKCQFVISECSNHRIWYGPVDGIILALRQSGKSEYSQIVRQNPDGTDTVMYQWLNNKWVSIN